MHPRRLVGPQRVKERLQPQDNNGMIIFQVSNLEFPHRKDPSNCLRDTLLDGEMIIDIVNGQKVPRFLIYDIVKYAVSFEKANILLEITISILKKHEMLLTDACVLPCLSSKAAHPACHQKQLLCFPSLVFELQAWY